MKTIEEKAKEYLNSQLTKVDKETVNGLTLYYFQAATVDGYIKGHEDGYQSGLDEFALAEIQAFQKGLAQKDAEWQEKIRWIPVEEKLPERNVNVEIKRSKPFNQYILTAFQRDGVFYSNETGEPFYNATHWREIIE